MNKRFNLYAILPALLLTGIASADYLHTLSLANVL